MSFTLLTSAKFFMFELARSLNRSGNLQKILTGYPKSKIDAENIKRTQISSHPLYQIAGYGIARLPFEFTKIASNISDLNKYHLDHCAAKEIGDSHLISMSGLATKTSKIVKERGNVFIVNRSSNHILSQEKLLKQEFLKWKWEEQLPSKLTIERELEEYENAYKIVVPSHLSKQSFLERGFSNEKIIVNRFPMKQIENQVISTERSGVLFVGNVTLRKGFPTLVNAFNSMSNSNSVLHVAGVYSVKFLKHLTSIGLDLNKVHFHGPLNSQELESLYSTCEMFVLPSIEDGWGMVVNEALSYGCVPIVSDGAGASEMIINGVNGYTFRAGDSDELLKCMIQVADRKDVLSISALNFTETFTKKYTWDDFASTYVDILR